MFKLNTNSETKLITALIVANSLSVVLLANRVLFSDSDRYIFLLWNAILAAIPVFLAYWLVHRVRDFGWLRVPQIALTAAWLAFLPNSFYILTDLVHLRPTFEADIFYDIVLISSFWINGLILGLLSIFLVHKELNKKLPPKTTSLMIGGVILISSFAVYLGRFTRWNSWDILLQPAGLLFDVSDRFVNPSDHPQTFEFTVILFLFFASVYYVIWQASNLQDDTRSDSKK